MSKKLYAQIFITFIISIPFIVLCIPTTLLVGAYTLITKLLSKLRDPLALLNEKLVSIIMFLPRKISKIIFPSMVESMREVVVSRNKKASMDSFNRKRGNAQVRESNDKEVI